MSEEIIITKDGTVSEISHSEKNINEELIMTANQVQTEDMPIKGITLGANIADVDGLLIVSAIILSMVMLLIITS